MRLFWIPLALAPSLALAQRTSLRASGRAAAPPQDASSRAREVAPTVGGSTGLLRMRSADVGPVGSFRLGLHTELFSQSDFLVQGDEHDRFIGTLALAGTPIPWLEACAFTQSASNANTARRPGAGGDVILALGDFGLGAKGRFGGKEFSGGPETQFRFLNAIGGTTPEWSATSWYMGAVATLAPSRLRIPARAHLNAGYHWDRSRHLCPTDGACSEDRYPQPVERMVEEFGQGLNRSRVEVALGVDLPLTLGRTLHVWPMIEYHLAVVTGSPDAGYQAACASSSGFSEICGLGRDSQTLVAGVRARPLQGLFVDLGVDVGLVSPGAEYGPAPAVPPWNFILGLSYAHDPSHAGEPAAGSPTGRSPGAGRIRGVVLDAKSGDPIEGAVVVFTGRNLTGLSTDPDGGFLSYELPAGTVALSVRHAAYVAAKAEAVVPAGRDVPLEVRLDPTASSPEAGSAPVPSFSGHVTDASGAPLRAVARIDGPEKRDIDTDDQGAFATDLPPGDYLVRFEAADYLAKEQRFQIETGRVQALAVVLSRRPAAPRVQIAGKRIVLKSKVHFGSRNARLRQDSGTILDEVADLLLAHPEIGRVRVEGHTDNRGDKRANQKLSQQRADAVRSHLVQRGVAPERLEAVGYGASRPLVPNLGERNRAKNRRVELRILD